MGGDVHVHAEVIVRVIAHEGGGLIGHKGLERIGRISTRLGVRVLVGRWHNCGTTGDATAGTYTANGGAGD